MKYYSRAPRVSLAGATARLANNGARVVNVSRTGALLNSPRQLAPGLNVPVTLELEQGPVNVTARVVRSETTAPVMREGMLHRQFAIALTFDQPSTEAQTTLEKICGKRRGRYGVRIGPIHLSGARYCPRCFSRSVVKDSRRRYLCDACEHTFRGIRIGFLRIAF
jgi:PilZ domain-containing protein